MAKRVMIVGNGPLGEGLAASIDAADLVIRFNEPPHPAETAGTKTDLLFVVNAGKSMQARLQDPRFMISHGFNTARRIVLPYHPDVIAQYHPKPNMLSRLKGRRADWTWQAVEVLGRSGKEIIILPPQLYERVCAAIGITEPERIRLFPSTGVIGISYALETFPAPAWQIEFCGFGWHGWKRHSWDRERSWVERQLAAGRLGLAGGFSR